MIRSLRKRPRPDNLVSQKRKMTNSVGRMIYLALFAALALALLNFLAGDFVFLRADGLVVRNKTSVATTYIARVRSVEVSEGETVKKGAPLLRLQSTQLLEKLAELSAERARLAAKTAEFKVRSKTIAKLLPLAQRRERETAKVLQRFDQLSDVQLVTSARHDEALRARLDAREALVRLTTANEVLKDEIDALNAASADAATALADLRVHYADGVVHAPQSGSIGAKVPSVGDVYRPGESILALYSGPPYVLAYLPARYLFRVRPGMKVAVKSGRHSAVGVTSETLPVTDALPEEFQNTFKPRDRNQLAKIRFDKTPPFPLHEKVEVSRPIAW